MKKETLYDLLHYVEGVKSDLANDRDSMRMDKCMAGLNKAIEILAEERDKLGPLPENNFTYLRRYYNVPARRGMRVTYTGGKGKIPQNGVITSCDGAHIRIRFDGEEKTHSAKFHPTWEMIYH